MILKQIKQAFCKHMYESLDDEQYIGQTLDWSLKPTNQFQCTYKCKKCDKQEIRRYIYFGGIVDK